MPDRSHYDTKQSLGETLQTVAMSAQRTSGNAAVSQARRMAGSKKLHRGVGLQSQWLEKAGSDRSWSACRKSPQGKMQHSFLPRGERLQGALSAREAGSLG